MNNLNTSTLRVYACGGTGVNIASHFETFRGTKEQGFASVEVVYIDTSTSNIGAKIPQDHIYLIENFDGDQLEGSGKLRTENREPITKSVLDVLQKHSPMEFNIVLSSGSGGSGSVIAPSIASELLGRGLPTIVIMVGSTDSSLELENTIKTMKSYEGIAKARKVPVPAFYFENSASSSRSQVDGDVRACITILAAFFSKQNRELDSTDLRNWLYYTKVTSYDPHLVLMDFFSGVIDTSKPDTIITVATLTSEDVSSSPGVSVEYQCVGFISADALSKLKVKTAPVHCAVLDNSHVVQIHKSLAEQLKVVEDKRKARVNMTSILSTSDRVDESGLVF